ncbi:MAG: DUF2202 domain-containing protein [Flavipsychrobacter sp.]
MRNLISAVVALALLGTTVGFTSCKKDNEVTPQQTTQTATLSDAEKAALSFLREEEKMARDVYDALLVSHPAMTFLSNIRGSEQKHMDAVKNLLDQYGIADPIGNNAAGVFTNADIQQLYNTLVAKGQKSELDAVIVGLTIEDMDIKDLQDAISKATQDNIKTVYGNLQKASKNHMREFYTQLTSRNGTYTPQYITQAEYDAIVNSPKEHGSN